MTLTDGAELYICVILTLEFWYDYWYNTRENRIKRRKASEKKDKSKKAEMEQPIIREGTISILQEPGREVRDLSKTTKPL